MVSRNEPLHPLGGPLRNYILQLRRMLDTVWVAADVPKIRDDMIDTLIKAIMEADLQAKAAPEATESGVPPKARWYQLVGYLVQVLDGVCRNVEISELNQRMSRVEKELGLSKTR